MSIHMIVFKLPSRHATREHDIELLVCSAPSLRHSKIRPEQGESRYATEEEADFASEICFVGINQVLFFSQTAIVANVRAKSRSNSHGMATVMTMPNKACAAVARAMVLERTFVADTSHKMTKQIGPTERP